MTAPQLSLFPWFGQVEKTPVKTVPVRSHTRRVSGESPKKPKAHPKPESANTPKKVHRSGHSGQELRDMALAGHERRNGDWLSAVRLEAARTALARGTVSADDIAHIPLPDGASANVRGVLFNSPWFEFAGFVRSERPEAHRNRINSWRLSAAGRKALE